jgi:LemA protein
MYNSLVGKKNQVENIFASVDTQLKKRYDLIPNLVSSVSKYMEHEKSILEDITKLRAAANKPNISDKEKINLDTQMSKALGSIMIAVENYPELKANENVMHLQHSLNEVEEQIAAARRAYNQSVTDYNNALEMIPTNFMASAMGYRKKDVFVIPEDERKNVNVGKLFNKN